MRTLAIKREIVKWMFCVICIGIQGYCYANDVQVIQRQKQVDSLFRASTKEIYENPNHAIEVGLEIFNDENNSERTRLRGLMLISTAYSSKRDYQRALEYMSQANEFSSRLDNTLLKMEIVTKMGVLYQQLKIYDKAIRFLDESEKICLAYPVRDSVAFMLASNYIVKGFIYKERLNCEIAIGFFNKGIKEYGSLNNINKKANVSIAQYNIGNCYILSSNYKAAKESFEKSIQNAEEAKANSLQAFAKKGLAEVYTLEGKYIDAIELLNDALASSKDVGDLVLYQGIYKGLADNYLAISDWENYKTYSKKYLDMQLKVKQSERKSIGDSIKSIQEEQKQKLSSRRKEINFFINLLAIIGIALLGFTFFRIKNNKKKIVYLQESIANLQKNK